MNKSERREMFKRFRNENPTPTTELNYTNTFELLIAVMLSAQTTDIRVNLVTAKLFPVANTPQALLDLGEESLKKYIQSIGLFNAKASHIMQTCARLISQFQGKVPETREELESLPGVGRKTANVVLNTAFKKPTVPVDTHVFRVANRTGLAKGTTTLEVENNLMRRIDSEFLPHAHHWLILHGRYICKARKPECPQCIIRDLCEYKFKTLD
jgi:endonuclease-3